MPSRYLTQAVELATIIVGVTLSIIIHSVGILQQLDLAGVISAMHLDNGPEEWRQRAIV